MELNNNAYVLMLLWLLMETKVTDLKEDDLLITTVPTCIWSKLKLRETSLIRLAPEQSQLF